MIALCPTCRGKVNINPLTQIRDIPCETCDGRGQVDTDNVCFCGRPAIKQSGNILTCSNAACIDKALGVQQQGYSVDKTVTVESDDDAYMNWWNGRGCY